MDSLENLQKRVTNFRDERDWRQFHTPKDLAAAISIEAAELQDCFKWKNQKEIEEYLSSKKSENVSEEMGDILLYLLSLADILDINLIKATNRKLDINNQKYPADKSRGNAKKYTEFE